LARYLAIDWDQNQLHVIAADVRGADVQVRRATLTTEAETPNPSNAEAMGKLLAERLAAAGIAGAPVLACLGRDRLIVKEIRHPRVPDAEEAAVVRFQTVKELTDAPEDVVIDYMPTFSPPEGEQRAMALVIRKEVLQTYRTLCEAAGLKLASLSPRLAGTAACLQRVVGSAATPAPDPADGAVCVVILGEKQAELSILKGRVPFLARSVTNASNLAAEVRRNLAVHAGQAPQHPVRAVYLAGKGAEALRDRLADSVEVPVYTFDPFSGSESTDLPATERGTFAGAMGMLHARAAGDLPIDFVSPRQPRAVRNPNYGLIRMALVASVTLFIGLAVLGRVLYASWSTDLETIKGDRVETDKDLLAVGANRMKLATIDKWDAPVWLDEMYELNALIPDVNALRVISFNTEVARNPDTKAVAKWTIKGKLLKSNSSKLLDQLVDKLREENYYRPEPPRVVGDDFTLVVFVERRGPTDYTAVLPEEKTKAATKGKASGAEKSKETPKAKGADAEKGKAKADESAKGKAKNKRSDDNQ
jgi:Tfp pilus assembly PilM family ATPase